MTPTPMRVHLESERLRLRRFTPADAALLYDLDGDPDVIRFTDLGGRAPYAHYCDRVLPRNLAYYGRGEGYGYWALEEKASGDFLGWFHFRPAQDDSGEIELGCRLKRSAWGRGYATEMARALVCHGFATLGVPRITATALAANRASVRVLEKAGLRFHGDWTYEFTDPATGRVTPHPAVRYALDRRDYAP
jgi:RimJ/RimL family protein N-acetyltransferase